MSGTVMYPSRRGSRTDTNSLVLKRMETTTKVKQSKRGLLWRGYTVRGEGARAGRRKPVSY